MRVKVRTMRQLGHMLPQKERNSIPPFVGVLNINEHRDLELGRAIVRAQLFDRVKGGDIEILPELRDARLVWLDGTKLHLSGLERVGQAAYAQTWSVEVEVA